MRTVICEGVLGGENYTEIRIFLGIIQHPPQKNPKQKKTKKTTTHILPVPSAVNCALVAYTYALGIA